MKRLIIAVIIFCIGIMALRVTAFAGEAETCAGNCQKIGDSYYEHCLNSVAENERPMGLMSFGKPFKAPAPGYPSQKYCYEYSKDMTSDCFNKCPEEMSLFGPYKPSYSRSDVVDPEVKKAQEEHDACESKCLYNAYDVVQEACLGMGRSEDQCMDEAMKYYLKCSGGCQ